MIPLMIGSFAHPRETRGDGDGHRVVEVGIRQVNPRERRQHGGYVRHGGRVDCPVGVSQVGDDGVDRGPRGARRAPRTTPSPSPGTAASADPRGTTAGTWARRQRGPPGGGPGGEGAPEREGGGLGGCCASARLRITEVRIWLNQVSSHSPARYDRSAPPDASPAASPFLSHQHRGAASRPSRVQSETNHPSPPAGRVASNGGGAGPSSPLCATTPPPFAPPE